MKRPPRPRPLARRTPPARLPRTVRDRGTLALRAAPPLRAIGSLAVTPDKIEAVSPPVALPPALISNPVAQIPNLGAPPISVATPPVASAPVAGRNIMRRRGEFWDISYQQKHGVIADCRGLQYIALLVRDTSGGRDPIHAKELTALVTGRSAGAIELEADDTVLDAKAKSQLMKRLEELASERDRATAVEDFTRAARLDDEYEQIADELGRAGARRGATRRTTAFVHAGEKARKAVAKAIAEAIAKIAAHPELSPLAEHLTTTVRKGQWLSYNGSSDWQIDFVAPLPRK
jgi:hypothetical protein